MNLRTFLATLLMMVSSCGGPQHTGEADQIPLGQARAVEIFGEVIAHRELSGPSNNVSASLSNGTEVNVDVLVVSLGAGFVYLNEQDRRSTREIPPQSDRSELYVVRGTLERGQEVLLLVIQDGDFVYLPNPDPDQRRPEDRTLDDVEARLRRDSRDFLQAITDLRGHQ
jgi:hypothetical protein